MKEAVSIKKILCPVDFSEYSTRTLGEALFLAEKLGAELIVMNVLNQRTYEDFTRMIGRYDQMSGLDNAMSEAIKAAEADRVEKMKALLAEVDADRVPHFSKISYGVPYEKILNTAEKEKVDLIVLGAYGRGSLIKQLRFGSNAEKVFRRAQCRVLFIR